MFKLLVLKGAFMGDRCVEVVPSSLELKVQEEDTKREAEFRYFDPVEFECSVSVFGHYILGYICVKE